MVCQYCGGLLDGGNICCHCHMEVPPTRLETPPEKLDIRNTVLYGIKDLQLECVVIPASVTEIGLRAFAGCTALRSVVIPSSVTYIGGGAWKDCIALTKVILRNDDVEIGADAFGTGRKLPDFVQWGEDGHVRSTGEAERRQQRQRPLYGQGICHSILNQVNTQLIVDFPFLAPVIFGLEFHPSHMAEYPQSLPMYVIEDYLSALRQVFLQTDGFRVYYDPVWLVDEFRKDARHLGRDLLHVYIHCLYGHCAPLPQCHGGKWDFACDIFVERLLYHWNHPNYPPNEEDRAVDWLYTPWVTGNERGEMPPTAKTIYERMSLKFYSDMLRDMVRMSKMNTWDRDYIEDYFPRTLAQQRRHCPLSWLLKDHHNLWHKPLDSAPTNPINHDRDQTDAEEDGKASQPPDATTSSDGEPAPSDDTAQSDEPSQGGEDSPNGTMESYNGQPTREALRDKWRAIAQAVLEQARMETAFQGQPLDDFLNSLEAQARPTYDYATFLRRFMALREEMQVNMDEFDYIYYSYGLELYGDIPLIEPLEFQAVHRIEDMVIAIDTSGSVSEETVKAFLRNTYCILTQQNTFAKTFNLHILQCDDTIQQSVCIHNQQEFELYLQIFTIKGRGGTDFRPVFRYVEEMIDQKAFHHLKGLLYFSDGWGTFPANAPDYDAAFIFLCDLDYQNNDIPYWITKILLDSDEIHQLSANLEETP